MDFLNWKLPFIAAAIICWGCYVMYQSRRTPGITKYWGFRTDNFWQVARTILPFGIASLVIFICIGYYQGTINITWHIIPILILYPIWGTIQQFLLIALTVGNLQDYKGSTIPKAIIIVFAALLFGLIHYPFAWLMAATFLLSIFYSIIYFKQRNIFALGIFHGWLGGFFYYTVVNRDPFVEAFGRFLHSR